MKHLHVTFEYRLKGDTKYIFHGTFDLYDTYCKDAFDDLIEQFKTSSYNIKYDFRINVLNGLSS